MCLETVDGARLSNSTIWQTHNSPLCASATSARSRFSSAIAPVIASNCLNAISYISPCNEIYGMHSRRSMTGMEGLLPRPVLRERVGVRVLFYA